MSRADVLALLPLLITAYGATALMLFAAFRRSHLVASAFAVIVLAAAFASVFIALPHAPRDVALLLRVDSYSLYFLGLVLAGALAIALICHDYLRTHAEQSGGFYILLLFAVLGMEVMICSVHLISLFLGVEILSISLYGLIGYTKGQRQSIEGAVKYLVLAATASAFLLFGVALVYADTGTMAFSQLSFAASGGRLSLVSGLGLALILVGFGFKLAVVPFHMWSPDVYQGAPAPVTALIATGSKAAVLVVLLRLALTAGLADTRHAFTAIAALSAASMIVGNLLALVQTNVKRLLAYSSIAQMGYLLIPLLAGGTQGPSSIAFYLVSYFATTIAAFGIIAVVSNSHAMGDVEELHEYRGLGYRHPVLGAILALSMLSLTGIPPTAGFIAKFYIFSAAARSGLWGLLIAGVVASGISAFYYLRVLVALYTPPEPEAQPLPGAKPLAAIALAISVAAIVAFGLYPVPLIRLAELAVHAGGILTAP